MLVTITRKQLPASGTESHRIVCGAVASSRIEQSKSHPRTRVCLAHELFVHTHTVKIDLCHFTCWSEEYESDRVSAMDEGSVSEEESECVEGHLHAETHISCTNCIWVHS